MMQFRGEVLQVQVYADVSCPWCRLAHHKLTKAIAQLDQEISVQTIHRPFQLNPAEPDQPRPVRQALGEKYSADKVDRMFSHMIVLGRDLGLDFQLESALEVNTLRAHQILWLATRDAGPAGQSTLLALMFDAFFQHGLNVGDVDVLVRLAAQVGMDAARTREALLAGEGRDQVRAEFQAARARGVSSVPSYEFPNGDLVVGSQDVAAYVDTLRRYAASAGA
jgi:predicted DsbA family dithiol-disulfide isomerase